MKKNKKHILTLVLVLFVVIFSFYLYKLHSLAVEGNKIYALRCTKVNPRLITYKESFLKFADSLKKPGKYSDEEVRKFFYDYIDYMRKYIPEESLWLEKNSKFINRWDFQLIEPWYIKQAGEYQHKMYEGYRDDAKFMLEIYDNGGTDEDLSGRLKDARERRNQYSQLYFDFYDKVMEINDWRKIFGNVPIPEECTEDVLVIPDTGGALDMEPTPMPIYEPDTAG